MFEVPWAGLDAASWWCSIAPEPLPSKGPCQLPSKLSLLFRSKHGTPTCDASPVLNRAPSRSTPQPGNSCPAADDLTQQARGAASCRTGRPQLPAQMTGTAGRPQDWARSCPPGIKPEHQDRVHLPPHSPRGGRCACDPSIPSKDDVLIMTRTSLPESDKHSQEG